LAKASRPPTLWTSTWASTQSPTLAPPAKSVVTLAVVSMGEGVRLRVVR
jgi:hypothetical protein